MKENEATTAIFYAIISTQPGKLLLVTYILIVIGLSGIDLGHLLIMEVVKAIQKSLPRESLLIPQSHSGRYHHF